MQYSESEIERIKDIVEREFEIEDIREKDRSFPIPMARQFFSKIVVDMGASVTFTGKYLGLHHATIIHHKKSIEGMMEFNHSLRERYNNVIRKVESEQEKDCPEKIEEETEVLLKKKIISLKFENKKLNLKVSMLKNDILKKLDDYFLSIAPRYGIADLPKIEGFKTWSDKQKINEMLRIDGSIYSSLGSDSTQKDKDEAKRSSRLIYKHIKKIDPILGNSLLAAMDM